MKKKLLLFCFCVSIVLFSVSAQSRMGMGAGGSGDGALPTTSFTRQFLRSVDAAAANSYLNGSSSTVTNNIVIPSSTSGEYIFVNATAAVTNQAPTGNWNNGQALTLRIVDNGTARAITWSTTGYTNRSLLPFITKANVPMFVDFRYRSSVSMLECVGVRYGDGTRVISGDGTTNNFFADSNSLIGSYGSQYTFVLTNSSAGIGVTPAVVAGYGAGTLVCNNTIAGNASISLQRVYAQIKETNITTAYGWPMFFTLTSSSNVTYTLHTPATGYYISIGNQNSAGISVRAPAGVSLKMGDLTTTNGGAITCKQAGCFIELVGQSTTVWEVKIATPFYAWGIETAPLFKITDTGAYCVSLINKTGSNTYAGTVAVASTTTDNAFDLTATAAIDPIGIVMDSGIPDGSPAWVAVSGIVPVSLSNVAQRRSIVITSSTLKGRGETNSVASATDHFDEIGHCITGGTTNPLVLIHFN